MIGERQFDTAKFVTDSSSRFFFYSADYTQTHRQGSQTPLITVPTHSTGWLRGTVVERRSLASELSLSCARPAADE